MEGEEVRKILEEAGAFWIYPGEPRAEAPHALLTSGKHSNGYINVGDVLKRFPLIRIKFAEALLATLPSFWMRSFNWVVGSDTSATDLAGDVAKLAGVGHIRMLKDPKNKNQIWHPQNKLLHEGDIILHIEELITTSSSALQVREGIRLANAETTNLIRFAPFLPVILARSDPENRVAFVERSKVLPLLRLDIRSYDPEVCPYCAAGSRAIRLREGNNWYQLK